MKQGTRLTFVVTIAGLMAVTTSAMSQDIALPAAIKDAGVLRASVDAAFPPMNYKDATTNEYKGVGVDVVTAIAGKLGVRVEFVESSYPQLLPGLETGRFDFIGSAMADFPERRESLTFVDYMKTGAQVFTLAENESALPDLSALCGKSVAHARFVTSYGLALEALSKETCVAAGKPPINVQVDDLPVQIALVQKRYDAGAITAENVSYLMQIEPNTYHRIGEPLRTWYYGFAFRKDATELRDAVAKAVQAIIDDGTYAEILKKHGIPELAIDAVKIDGGAF